MKKLLNYLFLLFILLLPFIVKADMGMPPMREYKVVVTNPDGINSYKISYENRKTTLKKDVHLKNEYHPLSIFPTTNNARIATLYVLKAIECSKNRNYSEVDDFIELAKNADSSFSDIYKIAGYLYSKYDSIKSEKNYNIALELAENKAPVYYFFAGSLINTQKYEMAEVEMAKAIELDSDNSLIKLRYARLEKMQNKFDISLKKLSEIDMNNLDQYGNRMEIKYIFEMIHPALSAGDLSGTHFSLAPDALLCCLPQVLAA